MLLPTMRQAHVDAPGPCGGKVARGGLVVFSVRFAADPEIGIAQAINSKRAA
jgi:hypothetical protein